MWPFVLKFLCDRAGEGSSVPTRLVLALWAPYFKETDSNLWGVSVQICYHGPEKSKRTVWRRWQFKLSLRRQVQLSKAKKGTFPAMSTPALTQ